MKFRNFNININKKLEILIFILIRNLEILILIFLLYKNIFSPKVEIKTYQLNSHYCEKIYFSISILF